VAQKKDGLAHRRKHPLRRVHAIGAIGHPVQDGHEFVAPKRASVSPLRMLRTMFSETIRRKSSPTVWP
jgi:hypothetical protein